MHLSEIHIRIGVFLTVIIVFAMLEALYPDRQRSFGRSVRWLPAMGLLVLGSAVARLVVPLGLAGIAVWAEQGNFGLLNQFNAMSQPIVWVIAFLIMDLCIWFQHVLFHKIPLLWRLHRVHHTDIDIDVSTALRFHPVEIMVSIGYKVVIVLLFGIPAEIAFWFEVILNASAVFNHANLRLPQGLERYLRLFVVTPQMHRVHHSVAKLETDSNYGFFLSLWDFLFRTYTPDSAHRSRRLTGLKVCREKEEQSFVKLLLQPVRNHSAIRDDKK